MPHLLLQYFHPWHSHPPYPCLLPPTHTRNHLVTQHVFDLFIVFRECLFPLLEYELQEGRALSVLFIPVSPALGMVLGVLSKSVNMQ